MKQATVTLIEKQITVKSEKDNDTVFLARIGHTVGKPAEELEVGDTMVWNRGAVSPVLEIVKETACFITVLTEYDAPMRKGEKEQTEIRFRKDRIVAIATE